MAAKIVQVVGHLPKKLEALSLSLSITREKRGEREGGKTEKRGDSCLYALKIIITYFIKQT
jgi:hypothetical protein